MQYVIARTPLRTLPATNLFRHIASLMPNTSPRSFLSGRISIPVSQKKATISAAYQGIGNQEEEVMKK
jgi:hypothetical protein